jgi:aryl-alcohol dehydrogenase-like predicted oxidoreductase
LFSSREDIPEKDSRRNHPRFQEGNFETNSREKFYEIAKRKKVTPAQLALAWLHSQGYFFVFKFYFRSIIV